ncbi:TolC family protein [Zoogloea sp.]|uniref:TolC family protein n=1 Tax=Zoogloea sp. TaxID=49181 RepID=UPI0035B4F252
MSPISPSARPCRPTRLTLLIAAAGIGLVAAGLHAEPLPAVVDKVLLQQPSVRSAQALLRAADAQITQVRSDFLPSLGLTYRNADSRDETQGTPINRNVRRSDANLRWNVFNGATDTNRLRAAGFTRDAADADLDNVLEQVAYELTENYSDVVRLRQLMASLQATIASQERVEANVAHRVDAGRISSAELDLMRVRLIQNRNLLGQLRAQLGTAEYRYRLLTGEAPTNLITPSIQPADTAVASDAAIEALVERIHERNPRLRAALQRANARQADVGAARGFFFPSVDLSYSKRLDNTTIPIPVSDTDRAAQVQVSLDIPLGGKNLGRHTEAVERHQAAQADADDLLLKVSKDITDLYRQYIEARQVAPLLEQRVTAAQRVAAAYELHFDAGRRSLNDLSIAQGDLFDAQRGLIENRAQQTTLQAQLLGLAGELRTALRSRYRPAPIPPELLGTQYVSPALVAAPVPSVEASPAPQVELAPASPAVPAAIDPALRARLDAWRAAWAAQDFDAYRAAYATDFQPGKGRSTADWENERRQRVTQAKAPRIRLDKLVLADGGADQASLRFVQHYSAAQYRDTVRKQLDWKKVDGQWKIVGETVLPAAPKAE